MGYAPDWNRKSMAKTGGSKVKEGIVSKPLFHGATENQPSREVRRFADGGEVYDETDKGMFGNDIKFRTDYSGPEARKYVATPQSPMGGSGPSETRYYSMDDVKNFFTGGRKQEADTVSTAPAPKTSGEPAPSAENEARKMNIAASAVKASTEPTKESGVFSNFKSTAPKFERADVEQSAPVEAAKPSRRAASSPARTSAESAPARSTSSTAPARGSAPEARSTSTRSNMSGRVSAEPVSEADVTSAQEAGTKFATLANYVKNLPAGTSPQDRARIGQLMRDAQTDYENKAKKVRRP
jgi:hypothetical protein